MLNINEGPVMIPFLPDGGQRHAEEPAVCSFNKRPSAEQSSEWLMEEPRRGGSVTGMVLPCPGGGGRGGEGRDGGRGGRRGVGGGRRGGEEGEKEEEG